MNGSLHYILNNEQGEWFDPHLKERIQLWDPIETWYKSDNKRDGAMWLGVSIRVFGTIKRCIIIVSSVLL